MSEAAAQIGDVSSSLAFDYLDKLYKDGKISKAHADLYKQKYAKLHQHVVQTLENEKSFLRRTKELHQQLMAEKIRIEKTTMEQAENAGTITQLREQLRKKQGEVDQMQEWEAMLQAQIAECENEKAELQEQIDEKQRQEEAAQLPVIEKLKAEIDLLEKEIAMQKQQKERHQEQEEHLSEQVSHLEQQLDADHFEKDALETEYRKIAADPERIRKQGNKFGSALKSLTHQLETVTHDIETANATLATLEEKRKAIDESVQDKDLQVQWDRDEVLRKEQNMREVLAKLEGAKYETVSALERRTELELSLKETNLEIRVLADETMQKTKSVDRARRDLKKRENIVHSIKDGIVNIETNKSDDEREGKQLEQDIARQKTLLTEIQAEVELFIGAFLKQESIEKEKKEELDFIVKRISEGQQDLQDMKKQEAQWTEHFQFLTQQREKMARESSVAIRLARETWADVQMKMLEENDLRKKLSETSQRQKDYCTLYEVVKNERNKYVTHIQAAEQQIAEMKERHKILQNEVEILKMESQGKDRALSKTRMETQKQREERDRLRAEYSRVSGKAAALNEEVEQYVVEIDKLNSIINAIEKGMIQLKRNYEAAVEGRNFTGIQLIDRNDELCILWEKANMQERLLKKGRDAQLQKDEELRILKIDMAEIQRQLQTELKKIPQVPFLAKEATELREQLVDEKRKTDQLSLEFEDPTSQQRKWRQLEGDDADTETLTAKLQWLEERLNEKKEKLLEKELVFDEISAFSEKLRLQAVDGRSDTLELSHKVNLFQTRLKELTKKMMAIVSELSMYQAMALKLQLERDEIQGRVDSARLNMSEGRRPTPHADIEFTKMIIVEDRKVAEAEAARSRKQEEEMLTANVTKTTAEPRVNAYIPEGEMGLPKAYGVHAPFMPSEQGSSMRHTRKPNPRPIEI
ncbi:unnamed protein product [Vitrella brassicaformis CCMP3155]|uniref:Cilia- and flagella-associated protein 58 central coiled coil domain-containing protein n=1 Tax=Vitrella brassicaformis (strain CCMP3155) TaxID=1169540 RepID=A0A0G4EWH2_VITBC|nr:unnamed protein product [Vitrella brassicaformis CCMP3155]|mmetsp:Transcript_33310/g.82521  ORF Transcript_33310/g.82521 Transcript_33310/m.82521 type:complete len:926 (-) Transcript_33310:696-3473(-)|eukprot:CEM02393.1 unnamed protein product [Vitrella brassicaformis CCMP3155]